MRLHEISKQYHQNQASHIIDTKKAVLRVDKPVRELRKISPLTAKLKSAKVSSHFPCTNHVTWCIVICYIIATRSLPTKQISVYKIIYLCITKQQAKTQQVINRKRNIPFHYIQYNIMSKLNNRKKAPPMTNVSMKITRESFKFFWCLISRLHS